MKFISIIYNFLVLPLLAFLFPIFKIFNKKFKEREGLWDEILETIQIDNQNKRVWFHAASMGEFEQAKPVIELIKKENKKINIIVTFFSPSGYNNQKDYEYADYILYLPFDFRSNVKYFLDKVKPDIAVFIRYEIWRNYLELLNKRNIPVFLICATKPNSPILYNNSVLKKFTVSNYNYFTKIYTVSDENSRFFKELGVSSEILSSADTRFDRIYEKVINLKNNPILPKNLFQNNFVLIGGSTWQEDEEILIESVTYLQKEGYKIKLILVPHEPTVVRINYLKKSLPHSFLLSDLEKQIKTINSDDNLTTYLGKNHIIVDSIGKLLGLYSVADAAYIGGGFGAGVHSVTEPAGYGIPIACGPKYQNSYDAQQLRLRESLKIINDSDDFKDWLCEIINDEKKYEKLSKINEGYIINLLGESKKISEDIIKTINH